MNKVFLILFLLGFGMQGKAQRIKKIKRNATAVYIPPKGSLRANFQFSSGAYIFDATKRIGLSNIYQNLDGTYVFRYFGEEQPDAIYETFKEFIGNVGLKLNDVTLNTDLLSKVNVLAKNLTDKSKAHIFLRSSLYRLNESLFNQDISEESYKFLFMKVIEVAEAIQLKELEAK